MNKNLRVAWLVPSVELGAYWQPVLAEFKKAYPQTIFYTGLVWPGFDPKVPGADLIQIVGQMKSLEIKKTEGYSRRLMILSPGIINYLLKFKPDVVLAQAYSLWTLLAFLFKPIGKWKLIIIWDGSSPNTDFTDSGVRSFFRKWISQSADAFISNSEGGKKYLVEGLGAAADLVYKKTYLVPDVQTLQQNSAQAEVEKLTQKRPIFLYVGRITPRKGINSLIEACSMLKQQGYEDYSLVVIGKGEQREELEAIIEERGLSEVVTWLGFVEYGKLGAYFAQADVFVFPTLEDIWGMVPLEAMVFGKPVLCSKWAGAAEMVVSGENGYIFDPYQPEELAQFMGQFLQNPELSAQMGKKSSELIAKTTPKTAADDFVEVISLVAE
ncbi:MAG: glycosyltransferase family 4 protein [Oscillatoria sp. PMC 1076.18]|nr:glycosyltransferase family 4 protein [Oscillatoria sp. PMC 1076.18]